MVGIEIQEVISISRFPEHSDLSWIILVHMLQAGVNEWNPAILFFLQSELDMRINGIWVIRKRAHCMFMKFDPVTKVSFELYKDNGFELASIYDTVTFSQLMTPMNTLKTFIAVTF